MKKNRKVEKAKTAKKFTFTDKLYTIYPANLSEESSKTTTFAKKKRGMPKEDYLIKYLEKLHRVIAAMLGWKETGDYEQAMKLADEITTETLQLHLQEILDMETEAFEQRVRKQNFGVNYLEKLCELLVVTTDTYYDLNRPKDMQEISKKTLILYRILNEKDKTFSFERESIISELEEISKNQLNK